MTKQTDIGDRTPRAWVDRTTSSAGSVDTSGGGTPAKPEALQAGGASRAEARPLARVDASVLWRHVSATTGIDVEAIGTEPGGWR